MRLQVKFWYQEFDARNDIGEIWEVLAEPVLDVDAILTCDVIGCNDILEGVTTAESCGQSIICIRVPSSNVCQ